jgi:hypothetical protein
VEVDQIVIVTNQDDPHADDVIRTLWRMGGEPIRLNTDEVPQYSSLTLELDDGLAGRIELETNGLVIDIERIKSIWWRRPRRFRVPTDLSPWEAEFAQEELRQAYRGLWASVDCYWISHPDAIERAEWKLGQLQRARELGFDVPRTLVTSDPAAALDFHAACGGDVVFKVMTGPYLAAERYMDRFPDAPEPEAVQTLTTLVGEEELAALEAIRTVPALFQERVPKRVELRVTVIGDDLFVAEIDSQGDERTQVDFRADFDAVEYRAGELPDHIAARCMALVRSYGLNFSAMDLVVTPDDRYVFLESNPNGQFGFIEQLVPELQLTEALATRLLRGGDD